jgi:cytochrome c-type biogenesis protein CcmH
MNKLWTLLTIILLALSVTDTQAQQEPLVFATPEQEARFIQLTTELRCLVCQNQNLADSDAPLAHSLREEIHGMLMAGQDDEQIKSFLIDRYGDFVLYRPAIKGNTLLLWLMPGILLGLGAIALFFTVRSRNRKLAAQRQKGEN